MNMDIKDLNQFLDSFKNRDQMRRADYEESIEELVERHLTKVDETWKSPHIIPKPIDDGKRSVEVLVRIAGTRGIGVDVYIFEIQDFALANHLGLKVTGWNYMTKGLHKALKDYSKEIQTTLTIGEYQDRIGEINHIFDHFDDSKFSRKERWNIPTIRELAYVKFCERHEINKSYFIKDKEKEKQLEEMCKAQEDEEKEREYRPSDWIYPVCVF